MIARPVIEGECNSAQELILNLQIANDRQQVVEQLAVIDTGFSGAISVPQAVVDILSLPFARHVVGRLADGSSTVVPLYIAKIPCGLRIFEAEIVVAGNQCLVGCQFLAGQRLQAEFFPGKTFTLTTITA